MSERFEAWKRYKKDVADWDSKDDPETAFLAAWGLATTHLDEGVSLRAIAESMSRIENVLVTTPERNEALVINDAAATIFAMKGRMRELLTGIRKIRDEITANDYQVPRWVPSDLNSLCNKFMDEKGGLL